MANRTGIEWCDLTINPIVGCSKCSPGCENCYAERFAARLAENPATREIYRHVIHDGKWNGDTWFDFKCFEVLPKKPKRIFIGSMGDVFHETVPMDAMRELFNAVRKFPQHTFILLTKRPKKMRGCVSDVFTRDFPNVWLGVTVCNQDEADEKIPVLLSMPAANRFVSIEPMLGSVDLTRIDLCRTTRDGMAPEKRQFAPALKLNALSDNDGFNGAVAMQIGEEFSLLDWVICGGETGPDARSMNPDWARSLRDQCKNAGVPFFFKQMTGKAPIPDDLMIRELSK